MFGLFEFKKSQPRDAKGRFGEKSVPPLVNLTVSNPFTYFKLWWQKVLSNEGVDLRMRIHPLTAIGASIFLALSGFGLGRISVPSQITKYIPQLAPDPWKDTAFTGMLRYSTVTKKFYLETQGTEAITLDAPSNINLTRYVGRRIFATGQLNTTTGVLVVADAQDLELLPTQVVTIPTVPVSPSPSLSPFPTQ